jgi:predicted CXXCH cytochrome family protein
MKKIIILVAAFSLLTAGAAFALLSGGPHDLESGDQSIATLDQKCEPCHVPHNPKLLSPPLWNHSDAAPAGGYDLYSSATLNGTIGAPGANTAACMGCHDGTVALDAFGTSAGTITITGTALIGTNLRDDHPVGILYDSVADKQLEVSPTSTLYASKVECASCHNVHDYTNSPFLRMSLTSSALCLDCHAK